MAKNPKRSSATNPFNMGSSSTKLSDHYKRSTDIWQQYSSQMLSLFGGAADPAGYMKSSMDLTLGLHRDLFDSCIDFICGSQPTGEVDTHCLTFHVDRSNEGTDAQAIAMPTGISQSSIRKSSLRRQGGGATIAAELVHLTISGDNKLYVSLINLGPLLSPSTFPLGVYEGAVTKTPNDEELVCIRVELVDRQC